MTNEELERAIDFLLKSQARAEARQEQAEERQSRTDEQIASTNEQLRQLAERLDSYADTQANILRVLMQNFEEQARINESLNASISKLTARQEQTEATVDRLSLKVEALAEQTAGTDRRLEALIKIVEGGRGGGQ